MPDNQSAVPVSQRAREAAGGNNPVTDRARTSSFDPTIHVPGLWRCAKCKFQLVQSNLNANDGTVTARDNAGDHCPNDGAPLWRVTWREHAIELGTRLEETWERLTAERDILAGQSVGDERLRAFVAKIARGRPMPKGVNNSQFSAQTVREWRRDAANVLDTLATPASECAADAEALRAENARLRAFTIYVAETPEDASGHPSIVADLKLKARELLK